MRLSGAAWTLLAVSAGTLVGVLYIHEGQRQEREVQPSYCHNCTRPERSAACVLARAFEHC